MMNEAEGFDYLEKLAQDVLDECEPDAGKYDLDECWDGWEEKIKMLLIEVCAVSFAMGLASAREDA